MTANVKMQEHLLSLTSLTPSGFVLTLGSVIIIVLLLRALYTTILYPEIFTPLKKIPTPPGRSLLKGTKGPPSAQGQADTLRYWSTTVPNVGLIRYYGPGNEERLLVTSPKALSEILVANVNTFVKPEITKKRLVQITGNGMLLAEGEEHRVRDLTP